MSFKRRELRVVFQLSPIKVSVFMSLFLCAGVAVFVAIHFMRLDKAIDLNDQMVILSLQKHFFCCHANGKHGWVLSTPFGLPFYPQFHSRIGVLVHSSFAYDRFRKILTTFQHNFKICLLWILHKKECCFYTHLFCCNEMR
jgi:hypothetical protein